jgi:hypothetical protein
LEELDERKIADSLIEQADYFLYADISGLILSGTLDLLQRDYARILFATTDKAPWGRVYFIY